MSDREPPTLNTRNQETCYYCEAALTRDAARAWVDSEGKFYCPTTPGWAVQAHVPYDPIGWD